MNTPKPPKSLARAGRALWMRMVKDFDVRGCEVLLEQACILEDRLTLLRSKIEGASASDLSRIVSSETKILQAMHRIFRLVGLDRVPISEKGGRHAKV